MRLLKLGSSACLCSHHCPNVEGRLREETHARKLTAAFVKDSIVHCSLYLSTLYLAEHRLHDDYDGVVRHRCLKPIQEIDVRRRDDRRRRSDSAVRR